MRAYLFSIFVRGFVAISGFMVFIITAQIYGAEGRGVIAYGTSLFASMATLLSFNLGRVFVAHTQKDSNLKKINLPHFILLNVGLSLLTIVFGCVFWLGSESAQNLLTLNQLIGFSVISFFYVWFHNGHPLFSSFGLTPVQDRIIFIIRLVIVLFLLIFWLFKINHIDIFIWSYSILLGLGAMTEIVLLSYFTKSKFNREFDQKTFAEILKKSLWPHLDYVSFNVYPLLLFVLAANYISKSELGQVNFAIQILHIIYLLATTANMKINTYVAQVGFAEKKHQFQKLLFGTSALSLTAAVVIYFGLRFVTEHKLFITFSGTSELFLIGTVSILGYISYQFFNPIWIEYHRLKKSALLNYFTFIGCLCFSPYIIQRYDIHGVMYLYAGFHILVFINNLYLYFFDFKS